MVVTSNTIQIQVCVSGCFEEWHVLGHAAARARKGRLVKELKSGWHSVLEMLSKVKCFVCHLSGVCLRHTYNAKFQSLKTVKYPTLQFAFCYTTVHSSCTSHTGASIWQGGVTGYKHFILIP